MARTRRRRGAWLTMLGGFGVLLIAILAGFNPSYGPLYALWFGWIAPVLILFGAVTLARGSGGHDDDEDPDA